MSSDSTLENLMTIEQAAARKAREERDAERAAREAAEQEVARLTERLSFSSHKREQCEINLEATERERDRLREAGERMAEAIERWNACDEPHRAYQTETDLDAALDAWRALAPGVAGSEE